MPPVRIACIGEAMIELSLSVDDPGTAAIGFAGDTLNTAIYLKRALPSAHVAFVTRLGKDRFSDQMQAFMAGEGLETSLIGHCDNRTVGLYAISTDDLGERSFAYWRDRSAARELFDVPPPAPEDLAGFDLIYLSAITLAILSPTARSRLMTWMRDFRAGGGRVAFDSNYRPTLWPDKDTARNAIAAFWALTDIGLPSVDDEQAIFGDQDAGAVLARLRAAGVTQGALKRGTAGPISLNPRTSDISLPRVETVIDSTAAGDSFNGAWLAAHLAGERDEACLRLGHRRASQVIQRRGAIIPKAEDTPC